MRRQRHRAKIAPQQLVAEAVYKGNRGLGTGGAQLEGRAFNLAIPRHDVPRALIDESVYEVVLRT